MQTKNKEFRLYIDVGILWANMSCYLFAKIRRIFETTKFSSRKMVFSELTAAAYLPPTAV